MVASRPEAPDDMGTPPFESTLECPCSGVRGRGGVNRAAGPSSVSVSAGAASHETDVVVIGSGVGGLSAAAMLCRHGDSVTVLESHYLPGGVAHAFDIEGYRSVRTEHVRYSPNLWPVPGGHG